MLWQNLCLEEEVTVVHDVGFDVKLCHETRSHLEIALCNLCFFLLAVELCILTFVDVFLLEEVNTSVALYGMSRELSFSCGCHSAGESWL